MTTTTDKPTNDLSKISMRDLMIQLKTSPDGLTTSEAKNRLNSDGYNEIAEKKGFFVTWYGSIGRRESTKSLSGKRLN